MTPGPVLGEQLNMFTLYSISNNANRCMSFLMDKGNQKESIFKLLQALSKSPEVSDGRHHKN